MIDKTFVETKLFYIQSYFTELEKILNYSNQEIKKDFLKLRALERVLQLIVDEIVDINNHIIRYSNFRVPENFQSSFMVLAENNILPRTFVMKIAPIVGLRNRLVHRYEKVDVDVLLSAVRKDKEDIKRYVKYIFEFLQQNSD